MLRGKVLLVNEDGVKITAHAFVFEPFGLTEADIWHHKEHRVSDRATVTRVSSKCGSLPNAVVL